MVLVWGDPKPEGVGLGFSSSLPVLPGVGVALRLAPSLPFRAEQGTSLETPSRARAQQPMGERSGARSGLSANCQGSPHPSSPDE